MNLARALGFIGIAAITGIASSQTQVNLGQLAYVKDGGAYVETLSSGKATLLPNSKGAQLVALSPRDGRAVYFVKSGEGGDLFADRPAKLTGYQSTAPYSSARALPAGFRNVDINLFTFGWAGDGSYVQAGEYRFDPGLNKAWKTTESRARAASRNGKVSAWLRDDKDAQALEVAGGKTAKARTVFSGTNAQGWIGYFQGLIEVELELAKEPRNWWIGDPAVSPDGEAVYFALNGGNSGGAAGNTQSVLFKLDSRTDRVTPLKRLPIFEGRLPSFHVSPDGKKLLARGSFHVSAAENPSFVEVVNLETAKVTSLAWETFAPSQRGRLTSLVQNVCWLRDSRTVAISGAEYDISSFDKATDGHWEIEIPRFPQEFSVYLINTVTGKLVKRIAGASSPSCR
jgi:WD40-like Beta Propeller Repeat